MSRRLQADLALTLCSFIWGATFVVVKDALSFSSVFVFNALRFSLAAIVLGVIYWRALREITRQEALAGSLMGFFLFSGYALQTTGLRFTSASKTAFITGSGVVLVPVVLAVFWGRRLNRWVWAGAIAALVGLYYLTVPVAGFSALNVGDIFSLCCAVMFALYIIFVGQFSPQYSIASLSFLQVASTALLNLIFLPIFAAIHLETPRVEWNVSLIAAVLITALGATALCFSLQVWAQQYASPTHTAILISLEPVFAALTAVVVSGEHLSLRVLAGAALVFIGIVLSELKGPTHSAADAPGPVSETFEAH
jgi:drug/metabolite transporter (DMT)-like permease